MVTPTHAALAMLALALALSTQYFTLTDHFPWIAVPGGVSKFRQLELSGPFPSDPVQVAALFRSSNPVKFTKSPSSQWTAVQQWKSVGALKPHLCPLAPVLTNVCACPSPDGARVPPAPSSRVSSHSYMCAACSMFYYDLGAKFMKLPNVTYKPPYELRDMDCQAALDAIASPSHPEKLYYSRPVADVTADPKLREYMSPLAPFADANQHVNLWVGSKGTIARMHYDSSPNWFLQVSGRKRFLLAPPRAHWSLYQFSFLHPGHRQCQVDIHAPDHAVFPNFTTDAIREVVLGPGESLYIPPMYFHQVESLEPSISINIYRDWPGKRILTKVFQSLPHFPGNIPGVTAEAMLQLRAQLARDYIAALCVATWDARLELQGVEGAHARAADVAGFVKLIVERRLSHTDIDPLLSFPLPPLQSSGGGLCFGEPPAELSGQDLVEQASEVSTLLLSFPATAALNTVLADYIEAVAASAVGTQRVVQFYSDCFPAVPLAPLNSGTEHVAASAS